MTIATSSPAFRAWWSWYGKSILPRQGGWADQPLGLLVAIETIDAYFRTRQEIDNPSKDGMATLTATQRALYDFVDNEWDGVTDG